MDLITLAEVSAAATAIDGVALRTPLLPAEWAGKLWLKPENLQPVGAFKIRGAANAISKLPANASGVLTHSSGNHGRALGFVAAQRGVPCLVVVPDTAPQMKIDAMRATGTELVIVPGAQREAVARRLAAERGYVIVPPYDHPDVIAGQATIGPEILSDLPDVDTIVLPIGGGGLASGVATAVSAMAANVRVIGVEPELAADAADSLRYGKLTPWSIEDRYRTIADGVRVELSELTFAHLRAHLSEVVTVTEAQIRSAVGELARSARLVAEPSGALSVAAFLAHGRAWGRTAAVISGGNLDPELLAELITA